MGGLKYHSALKDELDLKELDFYKKENKIVFKHDINDGVHKLFYNADCIYIEPAWRAGYEKFLKRAGTTSCSFNGYLDNIKNTIRKLEKPAFVVAGKHMLKRLDADSVKEIKLHGYSSYLCIYNYDVNYEFNTNYDVIKWVSNEFDCVLDFCCGYGNTLMGFDKFIASDINGKCVYYVAKNIIK